MNFVSRIVSALAGERFESFSLRCAMGGCVLLASTWVAVWCLRGDRRRLGIESCC